MDDSAVGGDEQINDAEWVEEDQYTVDDDAAFDEDWT